MNPVALLKHNEPIRVTAKDHGYFPKSFLWRGRRHTVSAVEQCWTVARRDWMGRVERHCFRVRTGESTFVLYNDLARNAWYVERVVGDQ
ncbi:MAG: hypothetical protein HY872_14300 [Chloroflexi bacterium]|nr:hypothetical protein [Chloroflexota bacterium]MBI3177867.1 hypothetical protein [Chloroflexota bacterium]MBI4314996.1 hypothetical protein [Chloroflexota bacterium]MBI5293041.1 hypothetical protein [Chloroflexota bacterium]